jgi:hypothetical protein
MDVEAPLARTAALPRVSTGWVVGVVVAVSALLQTALAWRRATPGYFPDEYMYAELGRSLLDGGTPLVRGESAGFYALLYPLLTAPAWLWDDVESAYRTIQAFNGVAMSLAAVPAFLLARRLGVGERVAVAVAALAVALPDLLYSGAVMAEAVAYPLALCVAWATVRAVERPSTGAQLLVLASSGLAATARIQLAVLPLCYALAVLVAGRAREHRLALAAIGLATVAGAALALSGSVGIYGDLTAYSVEPGAALRGLGANALVLTYASGFVLVPGALLGLVLALARPRSRGEHAFGIFALAATALLLAQASVVGDAGRVQERYALYALPLLVCLFAVYASRGWPLLRAHAVLAAALAAAAALVPLAGWAAGGGSAQSLVLAAVRRLEVAVGDVGLASLLAALGATALLAAVLASAALRPRRATTVALALAAAATLATTAAAASFYRDGRSALRTTYLAADRSWVDAAGGDVTLLVGPRSTSPDLHSTLFWNRSVRHVALLASADRPDAFAALAAEADGAGRLDLPTRLVLADDHGSTLVLRGAERVGAGPTKTLWRTPAGAQLELLVAGRYYSGLLAAVGGLRVWPEEPGGRLAAWLELELTAPAAATVAFAVELPGGSTLDWDVPRGSTRLARVPVCASGVWTAAFRTTSVAVVHGTRVGPRSSEPHLVADPAACP